MNIIHTLVLFQDTFSGATEKKIVSVSQEKFNKMAQGIGSTFDRFDKVAAIHYNFKVIEVRQAKNEDYL
jgi:hypothetical protein